MRVIVKILGIVILLSIVFSGCSNKEMAVKEKYAYTFRLAESHPEEHPTTLAGYRFAQLVEEKSDGRIQIVMYTNKSLGEERDVIEQVQFGAIDFARVSCGPMTEFVPSLNVIQLPYLYENGDHMWRVLNSEIGDVFLKSVEEAGFIGLTFLDAGARNFYNNRGPIEGVEDLKGMQIRVMQSEMMTEMVEALGAQAMAMPFGEVYGAILTGVIDGGENNWPSYETASHFETAKYYSIDEHIRVPEILIASEKVLEVLSEEDMLLIKEAAVETQVYQRKLWAEDSQRSEERLRLAGVEVNIIEDREAFRAVMAPLYEKYAKDYEDIVDKIRDMK